MGTWTRSDLEDAVALQGTLDTFALPDVLRLLAATKKSGRLDLSGSRGRGSIWVAGGELTAISVDHAPLATELVEAAFELLRFEDGSFTFDADAEAKGAEPAEVEPVLAEAGALLHEWREIEAVVPSLTSWVTMREVLPEDAVSIDRASWSTLVAVGSGASVASIGAALSLGELPASRAVRDLASMGLVDIEARAPEAADGSAPEPATSDAGDRRDDAADDAPTASAPTDVDEDLEQRDRVLEPRDERDAAEEPDEGATGSIPGPRARRARPRQLQSQERGEPDVFVPLDLSALNQQRSYDGDRADREGAGEVAPEPAELAAAFPGLAASMPGPVDDAEEAGEPEGAVEPADAQQADAEVPDGDEPVNRGLLLKFLSSVKS